MRPRSGTMKQAREVKFEVLDKPGRPRSGSDDAFASFVAKLMDSAFVIPGTGFRFGLDPLLGLLPGLGDTASALVSVLVILQGARRGVPKIVMARMATNVLLNTAIGAIPVAGDVFSLWFKSNAMNYALLRQHAGTREKSTARDWIFVVGLLVLLLAGLALIIIGLVSVIGSLIPKGR